MKYNQARCPICRKDKLRVRKGLDEKRYYCPRCGLYLSGREFHQFGQWRKAKNRAS